MWVCLSFRTPHNFRCPKSNTNRGFQLKKRTDPCCNLFLHPPPSPGSSEEAQELEDGLPGIQLQIAHTQRGGTVQHHTHRALLSVVDDQHHHLSIGKTSELAVAVKTVLGSHFGGLVNSPPILEPILVLGVRDFDRPTFFFGFVSGAFFFLVRSIFRSPLE